MQLGKSLKLDCGSPYGYHFRVTNKVSSCFYLIDLLNINVSFQDEKIIRDKKDIQFLISKKGGYLFRTTQLTKLNDEHAELKHAYEEIQEKIVAEILKHASEFCLGTFFRAFTEITIYCSELLRPASTVLFGDGPVGRPASISHGGERALVRASANLGER